MTRNGFNVSVQRTNQNFLCVTKGPEGWNCPYSSRGWSTERKLFITERSQKLLPAGGLGRRREATWHGCVISSIRLSIKTLPYSECKKKGSKRWREGRKEKGGGKTGGRGGGRESLNLHQPLFHFRVRETLSIVYSWASANHIAA